MAKYASTLINIAKSYIGCKESNGTHKPIIDLYNSHKPLARQYKVKYTDAWCATFVSACAIKAGFTDIIPTECGCEEMIKLAKKLNIWIENENRVPSPGEFCLYDWDDKSSNYKVTDNTGYTEHIGIVESVSDGKFVVIEGNYNNAVARRTLEVNGRYIRGFISPRYDKEPTASTTKPSTAVKSKVATDYAKKFDKTLAGTYRVAVVGGLHMRNGAGILKKSMVILPNGTIVNNYGYYTSVLGTKWLYCTATVNGVKYTGFSSMKYLEKC